MYINIMYNGTWQGPSFAPRVKAHPSLLHDGFPQIPFPALLYTFLSLPHALVSAPQFRVPAGLQAGSLPCK